LYDKSRLQKFYLGDAVFQVNKRKKRLLFLSVDAENVVFLSHIFIQVVKNGIRTPELTEYHSKDDFTRELGTQTRQMKMERAVLSSREYLELQDR
jgi:hypothetical protein